MIFEVEWYTNRSADNSVDMKQATTSAPKVEFDFHQNLAKSKHHRLQIRNMGIL